MIISVIQSDAFMSTILPETQRYVPANSNHFKTQPPLYHTTILTCLHQPLYNNKHLSTILPDTTVLTCLKKPPYNNIHLSTILPITQLYLSAYSNHLTITTTYLPYYQRHKYTYLPTATTLQQHPPVYHTTRDTTVFTCLQQPPYNNIALSTILPKT